MGFSAPMVGINMCVCFKYIYNSHVSILLLLFVFKIKESSRNDGVKAILGISPAKYN